LAQTTSYTLNSFSKPDRSSVTETASLVAGRSKRCRRKKEGALPRLRRCRRKRMSVLPIRHGNHARSSSLMPTLARVFSSTCLMMTAQYRLWEPSGAGRLPGTTTAPRGTRP
jgi:hypothetical protein